MDSNVGCLPQDILFAILTLLPVKSLCRFRCVSKSWFAIIANPEFIAAHLASSRFRPKLLVSVIYINYGGGNGMCSFFSIDYPEQDLNTQPLPATSYSSFEFGDSSFISTSPSGLICFPCSEGIKIGNPITSDFDVIPYPISDNISFLFGFDPVEDSHVILKLEDHDYTTYFVSGRRSGVFDLAENCWHVTRRHRWFSCLNSGICIHGVIYFSATVEHLVEGVRGCKYCLYAFDVRLKCFQMIERPPNSHRFVDEFLIEYNGRLALAGNGDTWNYNVDVTCLWILEDKENHIWSFKPLVVPWRENLTRDGISIEDLESFCCGRKIKLSGVTNRGELILATPLSRGSVHLFLYEIESNSLRRFEVDGFPIDPCAGKTLRFNFVIESLQSPKRL